MRELVRPPLVCQSLMALAELRVWEEGKGRRRRQRAVVAGVLQAWVSGSVLEMAEESDWASVLESQSAQAR